QAGRVSDDQDGPARVRLRPARRCPHPPVAVLHPGPAGAVLGDLRVGVRRQPQHHPGRGPIATPVYYVPGIIALGVLAACFGNLVASVTAQRERGALNRRRAPPVPAAALIAGRALTAAAVAAVMAAVLLAIGWAAYGAHLPGRTAPALAVTVVTGA